jgi:single-strand DNA-binding protein
MRGVNAVFLIGNLGKDPEVRFTQSGTAVANFSLATTERIKKGEEWTDLTTWHDITVFGKAADACGKHLTKGATVCVQGAIRTEKWTDKKTGAERERKIIKAVQVHFLGGGKKQEAPQGGDDEGFDPNDDIPF